MQRYMAGDFPRQEQQQRQQPGTARPPLYHAVQLGAYVLEQRGREGALAYASALLPVLRRWPELWLLRESKRLEAEDALRFMRGVRVGS